MLFNIRPGGIFQHFTSFENSELILLFFSCMKLLGEKEKKKKKASALRSLCFWSYCPGRLNQHVLMSMYLPRVMIIPLSCFFLNTELSSSTSFEYQNSKFCILRSVKFTLYTQVLLLQLNGYFFHKPGGSLSNPERKSLTSASPPFCRFWPFDPDHHSSSPLSLKTLF